MECFEEREKRFKNHEPKERPFQVFASHPKWIYYTGEP